MKSKMALMALFALVPLGLLAGCGGGGSSDSTSSSSSSSSGTDASGALSASDYTTEADKILEPIGTGAGDLGSAVRDSKNPDEFVKNVQDIENTYQTAIDGLNGLTPPPEAAKGHQELIDALQGLNDALDKIRQVAADNPTNLQSAASELQSALPTFVSGITKANSDLQAAGINLAGL